MSVTRVLIVEDSPTVRLLLEHAIGGDPRLKVVGTVGTAEEMLDRMGEFAPDVISLDIRLPGMNGLDATLAVMRQHPTPIVVVAAGVNAEDGRLAMDALRAGALAVVEKPEGLSHADYALLASRLCDQLVRMSKVKVVRQSPRRSVAFDSQQSVRGRRLEDGKPRQSSLPDRASPGRADMAPRPDPSSVRAPTLFRPGLAGSFHAVGIVASTGGPSALVQVLTGLGPNFPIPILLVQHIVGSFLTGFAEWLETSTPFRVRLAHDGERPEPGTVSMAPVEHHLLLSRGRLHLSKDPPLAGQRPSGSLLLKSIADDLGPRGIGLILTGMGTDGADGLLELHRKGGETIVEDESTCVVNGMPAAARALGAANAALPLPRIASRLRTLVGLPPAEEIIE